MFLALRQHRATANPRTLPALHKTPCFSPGSGPAVVCFGRRARQPATRPSVPACHGQRLLRQPGTTMRCTAYSRQPSFISADAATALNAFLSAGLDTTPTPDLTCPISPDRPPERGRASAASGKLSPAACAAHAFPAPPLRASAQVQSPFAEQHSGTTALRLGASRRCRSPTYRRLLAACVSHARQCHMRLVEFQQRLRAPNPAARDSRGRVAALTKTCACRSMR